MPLIQPKTYKVGYSLILLDVTHTESNNSYFSSYKHLQGSSLVLLVHEESLRYECILDLSYRFLKQV